MQIDQLLKDTIKLHKDKIELIQWAIISSVSSIVYSEYIKNIRQKHRPVRLIYVPSIKTLYELLAKDGHLMQLISEKLIDDIIGNDLFSKYIEVPEMILFNENNVEMLKTILDIYIIPNISSRLTEAIAIKFSLNNPEQQLFVESRDIDLFNRIPITPNQFRFIVGETILQLLMLIPSIKKDVISPEQNINIIMNSDQILTIDNDNAICPIHFNSDILDNAEVMSLFSFVSNTSFNKINGSGVSYIIKSGVFNEITLTRFN